MPHASMPLSSMSLILSGILEFPGVAGVVSGHARGCFEGRCSCRGVSAQVTVCVMQFLLGLLGRQASEAVRCRIDFKYPWPWSWTIPASTTVCWSTSAGASLRTIAPTVFSIWRAPEGGRTRARARHAAHRFHPCPGRSARPDPQQLELVIEAVSAVLKEVARTASHLSTGLVCHRRNRGRIRRGSGGGGRGSARRGAGLSIPGPRAGRCPASHPRVQPRSDSLAAMRAR